MTRFSARLERVRLRKMPMELGWLLCVWTVVVAIGFIVWDNRQMTRQAEREARGPLTGPFPDGEKWKKWDCQV